MLVNDINYKSSIIKYLENLYYSMNCEKCKKILIIFLIIMIKMKRIYIVKYVKKI